LLSTITPNAKPKTVIMTPIGRRESSNWHAPPTIWRSSAMP